MNQIFELDSFEITIIKQALIREITLYPEGSKSALAAELVLKKILCQPEALDGNAKASKGAM